MRVLLIDAFPLVRAAITGLLEQEFEGASVQGIDNAAAAWAALAEQWPDVVLLDLRVQGGLELLQRIDLERLLVPGKRVLPAKCLISKERGHRRAGRSGN